MKKLFLTILCTTFLVFAFSGSGFATLIGDSVGIGNYLDANPEDGSGSITIGSGVDWAYVNGTNMVYTVDIEDYSADIDFVKSTGWSFNNAYSFNGLKITGFDSTLLDVDVTTDLAGWDASMMDFGADYVTFNFSGLLAASTDTFTAALDFGQVVADPTPAMHNPVPAPILLLGTGLIGLAGFRKRVKK